MTRSLYVIGGPGTGKSTFMAQLMDRMGTSTFELTDLNRAPNSRGTAITLRGHEGHTSDGRTLIYLGVLREEFPGTDGLDRVSSVAGVPWLELGGAAPYDILLAEGATLGTKNFMYTLDQETELLVIHLWCDDFVKEVRFMERGSEQKDTFVKATTTRFSNLGHELRKNGVRVHWADSAHPGQWEETLELAASHVCGN